MPLDIDPILMQQLLETFRVQLQEQLQVISDALLVLEKDKNKKQQQQILDKMFRAAHNIKGASRGIGLEYTAKLSHGLESIFTALQKEEIKLQTELVNICLFALEKLTDIFNLEAQGKPPGKGYNNLLQQLELAKKGSYNADFQVPQENPVHKNNDLPEQTASIKKSEKSASVSDQTIQNNQPYKPFSDSIRLPVQRLDKISALLNELQISQLRIEQHHLETRKVAGLSQQLRQYWAKMMANSALNKSLLGNNHWAFSEGASLILQMEELCSKLDSNLHSTYSILKPQISNLSDDVHQLLLIPAETILNPLMLVVRDVAQTEKKKVQLVLEGSQLEIERAVLEKIRAPLIHLLRNAVDHGIELPEKRIQMGKDEMGTIKICLKRERNQVRLTIHDDGGGIDLAAISSKVLEQDLATEEQLDGMSENELMDYIFRPGFSSRQNISEVSGRGVGLDVVRSNLQALKGRVSVTSSARQGTSFVLNIPFAVSSEYGLFIRCSEQNFAISAQYVKRIMEISADDIITLESKHTIMVDGKAVLLQSLSRLLQLPETKAPVDGMYQVVVIHRSSRQIALIVNHILGEQEMVIKPLKPPLHQQANTSGGTLGKDGKVILVLNAQYLVGQKPDVSSITIEQQQLAGKQVKKVLVVDDSITTRTLEVSILEREGYLVESATNALDALEKLQAEDFDLLITDVEMPGMNGFELTHQVRSHLGLTELPVIIVTSLTSETDRRKGLEVKADAYIVKSEFESKELLNTVAQLL
ncbi:MAG: response regulator [Pseudomonadota bacterium]